MCNLLKIYLHVTYPRDFCIICIHFYYGKKWKYLNFKKNSYKNKTFCAQVVTTNGFALNQDKSLQIFFFCVKRQAKNHFLKDVESTVWCEYWLESSPPVLENNVFEENKEKYLNFWLKKNILVSITTILGM